MENIIHEGQVKIKLHTLHDYKGPGKKQSGFYNQTLEFDRDLSVVYGHYASSNKATTFLDGLSATGIRGIRMAKEIKNHISVDINDRNPHSYSLIKENIKLNKVNAQAFNANLCTLLQQKGYDYIDIDPYGSPVPYISCLYNGLKRKTYVSITATDTATLNGVYKKTCLRKYHASPLKGQASKEIGIRILIGYIAKQASSQGFEFIPHLGYTKSHYYRIYGLFKRGTINANKILDKIGWLIWDNGWKIKKYESFPSKTYAGPLWIDHYNNVDILKILRETLDETSYRNKKRINDLISKLIKEGMLPPLYYNSSTIARDLKSQQPKLTEIIETLNEIGYNTSECHFSYDGFKTEAPYEIIKKVFIK